jgi:hypothetical protein
MRAESNIRSSLHAGARREREINVEYYRRMAVERASEARRADVAEDRRQMLVWMTDQWTQLANETARLDAIKLPIETVLC